MRYGHGGSIGWHRKSWPESARPAPCGCTPTFWNGPAVHSRPSAQAFESASGLARAMRPGEHARIELCGRGVTVLHGHCWGSFSKDATPHPSLPSCGLWSVRVAALLHSPGWGGLDCALLIDMLDGEGGWMAGLWSWFVLAVEVCGGLGSIAWRELEVLATPGSEASGRSAVELPRYRRVAAAGTFHGPHSAAH